VFSYCLRILKRTYDEGGLRKVSELHPARARQNRVGDRPHPAIRRPDFDRRPAALGAGQVPAMYPAGGRRQLLHRLTVHLNDDVVTRFAALPVERAADVRRLEVIAQHGRLPARTLGSQAQARPGAQVQMP
jgi:hypothetical protein